MTTSSSKFRTNKEAPTEPFKRSVASCLKAAYAHLEEGIQNNWREFSIQVPDIR